MMKYRARFKMWPAVAITLIIISTMTTPTNAFFRHLCHGQVGMGRVDPLMSPGTPSQHLHNIQGASNFGFNPTINQLAASNCTSCSIRQDKSNYWQPQMYIQHDNGTFELVPTSGGLTAYYFTERPDTGDVIQPFPRGLRMITGTNFKRTNIGPIPDPPMSEWGPSDETQDALMEKSIGFNCLNYNPGGKTEGSLEYHYLRNKTFLDGNCADGIRAEIQFPSCWNGKDLDSADHKSHVAYPSRLRNGPCPQGFGTRLPALFFETIYQTDAFSGVNGQFVFANGDPTGYGYHADFICVWDDGVLQEVIDNTNCTQYPNTPAISGNQWDCPVFDLKDVDGPDTIACKMQLPEPITSEKLNFVQQLPGGVPVQSGPQSATMPGTPSNPGSTANPVGLSGNAPASSVSTASLYANATSTAPISPSTTPAPTSPPSDNENVITKTSVTVIGGTVYHWVILEEVITTTVMASTQVSTGQARRHLHGNRHIGGR